MWVKICGNTHRVDAQKVAELSADAVGFVFAPGKRQVTAVQVAAMSVDLPSDLERVGVFSSEDPDEIATNAFEAGLTAVQLHAGFSEGLLTQLAKRLQGKVNIIQTLHWSVGSPIEASVQLLQRQILQIAASGVTNRILIDSRVGTASGGTGKVFDWAAARQVFQSAPTEMRLIVAGGLNPHNVGEAIVSLGPWGVDVSSGVEGLAGRKDPLLVARFIQNARRVSNLNLPKF